MTTGFRGRLSWHDIPVRRVLSDLPVCEVSLHNRELSFERQKTASEGHLTVLFTCRTHVPPGGRN